MPGTTPPPDPKGPLVADARLLPRAPGAHRDWSAQTRFDSDLGLDLMAVPAGSPVEVEVSLTSASEGILAAGTVSAQVRGECSRCLQPIEDALSVEVSELYAYPDSSTAETTDADEVMRLQDELIDLEPVVRDALVFGMSSTPLCRPDCPGLCPECGERLEELPEDHGHDSVDPRWSALKKLLDK